MRYNVDNILEKLKMDGSYALASSRILLLWWGITLVSLAFLVIGISLIKLTVTNEDVNNLGIPLILISLAILLSYLVFKVNSLRITRSDFILNGRFKTVVYKHSDLLEASSFSVALWDPMKVAFYTKLKFIKSDSTKTYYVLNRSKLSNNFIEYPDLLIKQIKNRIR